MIGLIFCGDIKYCPYIERYIERLRGNGIEYTVYFWNRSGNLLNSSDNYKCYERKSSLVKKKLEKFKDFLGFRGWLLRKLKTDKPDKLIILSTLSGIFIADYLYRRKYCFDIRDYSYEHVALFRFLEQRVIKGSEFTVISSKGVKSFLPEFDYVIAHNFNHSDMDGSYSFSRKGFPVKIVWNGVIRYFDFQKKYIIALKNDHRFQMIYHGDGPDLEKFKLFCENEGIVNVKFTGSYNNAEKSKLLSEADILNNCYGMEGKENKTKFVVSNRFYDGIIYHIPQIVEPSSFKTDWALEKGVGINFKPDKHFADSLYEYYQNLDVEKFDKACTEVLKKVLYDDVRYIRKIDDFIRR